MSFNYTLIYVLRFEREAWCADCSVFRTEYSISYWAGNDFGPLGGLAATVVLAAATFATWRWLPQRCTGQELWAGTKTDCAVDSQ